MILLVCGGRTWDDYTKFDDVMKLLPFEPTLVVHGNAKGADRMAGHWAAKNGIHYASIPALWDFYGKKAGPLRNHAMSLLNIGYCMALPGGTGTKDMVRKCKKMSIPIWKPYG